MILVQHFDFTKNQLIDSTILTTRIFWRTKYCGASEREASDPRPWAEVVAQRKMDSAALGGDK